MLRKVMAATVLAAGCLAGAAQAAPTLTISYTPGGTGLPAPNGTAVVQDFSSIAPGTSIGTNAFVYSGPQAGVADVPATSTGNYAAVSYNGSYSVSFAPTSVFGFVFGTLDPFNTIVISFTDGTSTTLAGDQLLAGPSASTTVPRATADGFVSYTSSSTAINGVTFSSPGGNSFEFDTIEAGVPEPAAWGMMILGFGLIGGVLRRRSATTVRFA